MALTWPICGGGGVDFSSQAGLRKVTMSENILVVRVCGHCRPEELWVKVAHDVLHQGLLWSFKNVEEIVIFTLGLLCLFLCVRFAFSICSSSQSVVSHSLYCLCCFFGYGHVSVFLFQTPLPYFICKRLVAVESNMYSSSREMDCLYWILICISACCQHCGSWCSLVVHLNVWVCEWDLVNFSAF